ncbi:hypothetical protein ACUNV4_28645 [Granulosicoccus sp. 3-233]
MSPATSLSVAGEFIGNVALRGRGGQEGREDQEDQEGRASGFGLTV